MGLLYEVEGLEAVDEAARAFYKEADGKFVLDVEGVEPEANVKGLKTALVKERENVAAYSKFGKPDEIAARIAALEEKAKGTGKGAEEAQAKLDAMAADYKTQLAERDARLAKVLKDRTTADLKAELAKAGVVAEGLDMLATFAAQRIEFHDDGTPKIVSPDGKPMIGSGADHGATLSDLAKELAESMPYLVKDGGKGGSGKQPGDKGGTPDKTVSRKDFDAKSQTERMAFLKSGGKVTD